MDQKCRILRLLAESNSEPLKIPVSDWTFVLNLNYQGIFVSNDDNSQIAIGFSCITHPAGIYG